MCNLIVSYLKAHYDYDLAHKYQGYEKICFPTGVRTAMQPDCIKHALPEPDLLLQLVLNYLSLSVMLSLFKLFVYVLYVVFPQHKLGKWYFPSRNYQFPSPTECSIKPFRRYSVSKNGVTLKTRLGVVQGH